MIARLLVVGVAWLVVLLLFGALLQWSGSAPREVSAGRDGVTVLARSLNQLREPSRRPYTWTVTKATSALRELVVEVDALDPAEAPAIAIALVDGVRSQYDEVLVYVRGISPGTTGPVRRIEWTPRNGYLTSVF